jgi:hypothetical protein
MEDIFVALDTDRATDGSSDLNTKALSTWLENRINSNTHCLVRNSHCVATSKPNGITTRYTSRYYASLIPTCIHVGVYDVQENTNRVKIDVLGQALNGNVEIWAEVYAIRGGVISSAIASSLLPEIFTTVDLTKSFTVEIDPKEITANKVIVSVWMNSIQTTTASLQGRKRGTIVWTDYKKTSHDGFKEVNTSWDNFEADHIIKDIDNGRTWQLIAYWDVTGKGGEDGRWWGIQPLDGKRINTDEWDSGNDIEKHQISRFYHYSTYVSFERDPRKSTFDHSSKKSESMWAQQPVLGQHVSQHASNIDADFQTYRANFVGVEMDDYRSIYWFNESKKQNWPSIAGGTVSTVINTVPTTIEYDEVRVEVSGLLLGVELNAIWTGETDKVGYPPAINRIESFEALGPDDPRRWASPQANDSVQRIKGSIPAKVRVKQLANNDPDIYFTSYEEEFSTNLDITYWRATPDHSRPLLRGLAFGYHGDVFTTKRSEIRSNTVVPVRPYFNEGWLQNLDGHNDMQYLTPFTFTFDPPAGYDKNLPFIFELEIGLNDKTNYFSTVSQPVSLGLSPDGEFLFEDTRMHLHLVSWMIATRGKLNSEG